MPYHYLDDVATADVAFKAWGETIPDMFIAAGDAVTNVMVEDLNSIASVDKRSVSLKDESLEMLLFQFLQELVYYKDTDGLLLRASKLQIEDLLVFSKSKILWKPSTAFSGYKMKAVLATINNFRRASIKTFFSWRKDQSTLTSLLSLNEKRSTNNVYTLKGELYGEVLDPNKHKLHVDIKAITLHRFKVVQGEKGWEATVVLDI